MQKTARELAALVGGELTGRDVPIQGVAGIREAEPGDLSFIAAPRYSSLASKTKASAILVRREFKPDAALRCVLIRVADPLRAFAQIAALFAPAPIKFPPGIHPTAVIAQTVKLGQGVSVQPHAVIEEGVVIGDRTVIGAGCYIGHETTIGADTFLYPRVVVRERCRIGHRVILHSGSVIGADGFGYEPTAHGPKKIPQTGIVQIEDDVEIGACVTIDRARFGKTRIGKNSKIDNLCTIAHNVIVGENCLIVGMCGIAGSTVLGNGVTLAAQVGVAGHLEIGDGAVIEAKSGVHCNVPAGQRWFGYPAREQREAMRTYAALLRLPLLRQRICAIEMAMKKKIKNKRRK